MGHSLYQWGFETAGDAVVTGSTDQEVRELLNNRKYLTEIYSRTEPKYGIGLSLARVDSQVGDWPEFWYIPTGGTGYGQGNLIYERDISTMSQSLLSAQGLQPTYDLQLNITFDSPTVEQAMRQSVKQHSYGSAWDAPLASQETFEVQGTLAGTFNGEPTSIVFTQQWRLVRHDTGVY